MTKKATTQELPATIEGMPPMQVVTILDQLVPSLADLNPRNFTFEEPGDTKRGLFLGIRDVTKVDEHTGETETYRVAVFAAKDEAGIYQWATGGANLLSGLQTAGIKENEPIEIGLLEIQTFEKTKTYKVYSIRKLQLPKNG